MSDVLPQSTPSRPRFLDLLPDPDRYAATGSFHRALNRVGEPERAVQLVLAWAQVDSITQPEQGDRLERLMSAIEAEPELALGYARDLHARLTGTPA